MHMSIIFAYPVCQIIHLASLTARQRHIEWEQEPG